MYLEAGYDLHGQYEALLFHYFLLVPALGPRPTINGSPKSWKSFLTDNFSPLEYSWSWDSETPRIRYSIEAISLHAGTSADPFNQAMTTSLIENLHFASLETDWQWFKYFSKALGTSGFVSNTLGFATDVQSHPSSIFLGFEPRQGGVDIKAYFVPVKAVQNGQLPMAVVHESIKNLEHDTNAFKFPAYDSITSFIKTNAEGALLEPIGLAIDCVIPSKSRLKLYLRSPHTSFDSVTSILTFNGTLKTFSSTALADLHSLWHLLLSLPENYPTAHELPLKTGYPHPTTGILYNFDIQPGNFLPQSKVYIPVKHYAESDLAAAQGLATFLQSRKRGSGVVEYSENFLRMLSATWNHRNLNSTRGVQTYVSCTVKNGSLSLTSYLGAEIYHGNGEGRAGID